MGPILKADWKRTLLIVFALSYESQFREPIQPIIEGFTPYLDAP